MKIKEKIIGLLKGTKRKGIDKVISYIEENGFFEAPASIRYHGNYPGGLAEHSYNVYEQASYLLAITQKIRSDLAEKIQKDNIVISALLHDVCKSTMYKKVKKWRKDDATNKWEQYDTYEKTYDKFPVGHGERSVIELLQCGLDLTQDEILAIRWHMGGFDLSDYQDSKKSFEEATDKSPLVAIISAADWLASRITEAEKEDK